MHILAYILMPALVVLQLGSLVTIASPLASPQPQEASPPDFYRGTENHWTQMAHDVRRAFDETFGKRQIHNADYVANPNGTASSAASTPSEAATTPSETASNPSETASTVKSSNAGQKRSVLLRTYPMIKPHTQEEDEPEDNDGQPM